MEYEWMQNSHDKKAQKILEDKKTSGKKTLGAFGQKLNQTEKHKSKESMRAEKSILNLEAQTIKTDEDTFYAKSILQNILESSIDYSIVATDLNGKIIVWNEGAYRNYGYHASEMVNKKNLLFLHIPKTLNREQFKSLYKKLCRKGKLKECLNGFAKMGHIFLLRLP
ncbi:sensory box histidine kinase [Legionella cherrii]|uniref:Sensory box histidine kinase n=1 Tax=Legionella cherrii TaxID=28084 RepID=A0ABY6T2J5_9GAMM|nr:PAS domain-containing protein [Legionella cherrii]VEB33871.1 sensory box histidine kinase [Legionella cherrii]